LKKYFIVFILLFFLSSSFNSSAEKNIIKVAGDKYFPPYEFVDEKGAYRGFNIDIMNALSLYGGFEVEYVPMEWDEAVKALEEGRVDAILGMSKSTERVQKFDFSKPILINSRVIFVSRDNVLINSLDDLKGKKVSIQSGDISEEIVRKLQKVEIKRESTQEKALQDLVEGKVDAFIGNKYSGLYNIQKNKYDDIVKIVGEPAGSTEYCIAVKKGDEQLLGMINKALNGIKDNGMYDQIYYKWFGMEYVNSSLIVKKYVYIIIGLVLVFFSAVGIMTYINKKLKKMVDIRTKQLNENMEELSSIYEELYAQDEELQAQLEELRQSEEKLRELNERLRCLFIYSPDAIVQFDKNHIIMDINPAFERLFGFSLEECIGRDLDDIVIKSQEKEIAKKVTKELFVNGNVNTEGIRYTKEGKPIYVNIRAILMKVNEEVVGGYGIYTDITENHEYKKKLEYMSYHDNLTGIYNRAYFEEKLKDYARTDEFPVSIIMADLNGLKLVNDSMGHGEGDRLLIKLAEILSSSIRPIDVLARVGGDEFAIILPRTCYDEADKILKQLRENINKYNQNEAPSGLILSVSMGFATAYDKEKDLKKVMRQADEMMYHDKLLNSSSIRSQTLNVLLSALAEKDYITEGHAKRVKDLCVKIGERLGLSVKELSDLALLAEIHDLGKVAIPDSILNKNGPLNEEEWKIMKQHCEKGYRIALSSPDLASIADLILKHHERWDGKGYPLGLKGEEIPILCRILSVVDAYDAITSERTYSRAKSKEEALEEIKRCAGTQFDPKIVRVFLQLFEAKKHYKAE